MTALTPEFHTYADKPTALISGSYTPVRGGELRKIDAMLEQQGNDVPVSGFEEQFARVENGGYNTAHVGDCLSLLQALDFVEVSPQDVVSRFNEQVFPELSTEARLLAHIRQQTGRSAHLTYVSAVLARLEQRQVTPERAVEAVLEDDNESFDLSWNVEKIRFWANLLDTLGALSYTTGSDGSEILTSPTRALVAELLGYYAEYADKGTQAVSAFEWIDEWFLPVFANRAGTPTLAVAVADTLRSMEQDGVISMTRLSDSTAVVELPQRATTRTVTTITVENSASRVAYSYPLDRTTRRTT